METEMRKDPVCGVAVEITANDKSEYEGQVNYFCSVACLQKFENNPGQYVEKSGFRDLEHSPAQKDSPEKKEEYATCDDADPQSNCETSPQGSSVDEVYQKNVEIGNTVHPEIKRPTKA